MLTDLIQYTVERLCALKIAALWLLLSFGVLVASWQTIADPIWAPVIAGLGLVSFRLMDDLADVTHDVTMHPSRCLVQTRHLLMFVVIAVGLVLVSTAVYSLVLGPVRGLFYFGLACALAVVGRAYVLGAGIRPLVVGLVLLKYPAMILLVATYPLRTLTLLIAVVVYAAPLVDELISRHSKTHLSGSAVALFALAFWPDNLI